MPTPDFEITFLPAGRQLIFSKELSEAAHLFRRVGGAAGTWARLATSVRSPYLDPEEFDQGTLVEY